ncbi:MEKHLA domain-containing protein [Rhizobium sp. P40RR-XXII]|uniref:MEKHLA domain-containing protein n=1 Tax=unclassified Rhizobium TaxID=2613769 RepID=UPI00391828DA
MGLMAGEARGKAVDLSVDDAFFDLLTDSFRRIVGVALVDEGTGTDWLYRDAPFVVVAHNTDADPRFVYANKAAQNCFEYPWDEFVTLPSRLSAELPDRAERQRLLDAVTRDGFISDYRGLRIAKSGRRFWIEDGIVWQLVDRDGNLRGQAATFSKWKDA